MNDLVERKPRSVLISMADRFQMEPKAFEATVKQTVMPQKGANVTNEEFAAFLLVAKEYNLNPLTKEIYAFPGKGGGVQPIVSIDGWLRIINEHKEMDGIEFVDNLDGNGTVVSVTCKIFRKDRQRHTEVTEYMEECKGTTEPWRKWPMRMLRHKALIQCARYAFGFSGIIDPDEADRIESVSEPRLVNDRKQKAEELMKMVSPYSAPATEAMPAADYSTGLVELSGKLNA